MTSNLDKAQADGVVIGLGKVTKNIANRLDIDVLLTQDPQVFNLLILALHDVQKDEGEIQNKMHWFQVAGIHGLPLIAWDGVHENNNYGRKNGFYCTHGTVLFPTWHRPYLAMMEQTLYAKMLDIANAYEDPTMKRDYLAAADRFRLPYFDYFRARGGPVIFPGIVTGGVETSFPYNFKLPRVFEEKNLSVFQPPLGKKLTSIPNPFRYFAYPKVGSLSDTDWINLDKGWPVKFSRLRTTRQPDSIDNQNSNDQMVDWTLNKERAANVKVLLKLMESPQYNTYFRYATTNSTGIGSKSPNSLEGLHDNYHGNIGGSGHLGRVPVAAFDPCFWLHHCNIDRYAAVWQTLHDQEWFDKGGTELYPFRSEKSGTASKFWTSDLSRYIKDFGYSYPDFDGMSTPEALKQDFARRYRWSANENNGLIMIPPKDMMPIDVSQAQVFQPSDDVGIETNGLHARMTANKSALKSSGITSNLMSTAPEVVHRLNAGDIHQHAPAPQSNDPYGPSDAELLANHPQGTRLVREWAADSQVERNALNGAFTIMFFLGTVDDDANNWRAEPNLAGTNHVFTAPTEICTNCSHQAQSHELYGDSQPLNPMLEDLVKIQVLPSLHPEHVVPYLTKNLHWRVLDINRGAVDPASVAGLKVMVSEENTFFHPGSYVPEYGDVRQWPECTEGRTQ